MLFCAQAAPARPVRAAHSGRALFVDLEAQKFRVDLRRAMRVGGEANPAVRYQFDIFETARECKVEGAQFAIKVGVAGRLLIGPVGAAGAYSAPLRVVVPLTLTWIPDRVRPFGSVTVIAIPPRFVVAAGARRGCAGAGAGAGVVAPGAGAGLG